ncbi:L-ascorbate oxidase [Nilaparvata lugens]|uniref:Multicopper oxidase 4 n=1 Tax=Nilaparvata lugens TaxID=108931 RepID=A0A0H3YF00_NILLU|nr:L-ascorbate oxidase [Nilaparvata lugens]AKN21382.1 multicopper oxidase 4 [Nilaparvata lugens]
MFGCMIPDYIQDNNNALNMILLLVFLNTFEVEGEGEDINEQNPSGGFSPRHGFGGDCEHEQKMMDPMYQYLQPNDVASGEYDFPGAEMNATLCARPCKRNDPKICYYKFHVDRFVTMGLPCRNCPNPIEQCDRRHCIPADGYEKSVVVVNHMMPGPSIQVCEDDTIVVDVKNGMPGTSITIHWHGLTQTGTPHMDGVPMITQCPILEHQVFRYTFKPDNPGLFFWHSHSGLQKLDGFEGSLIVRQPDNQQSNRDLYDYDLPSHIIFIQDWLHVTADEFYQGLKSRTFDQMPVTYLINGRGRSKNSDGSDFSKTPFTVYKIRKDFSYLLHIISGTCLICPVRIQVESHLMTIVGTDGRDAQPRTVGSVTLAAGERLRVIINGKRNPQKYYYWIHASPMGICENLRDGNAVGEALLVYTDGPNAPTGNIDFETLSRKKALPPPKTTFGDPSVPCTGQRDANGVVDLCYKDLRGDQLAPLGILEPPDEFKTQVIIGLGDYRYNFNIDEAYPLDGTIKMAFNAIGTFPMTNTVNGIAFLMPPAPLLTQYEDVPECLFCSSNNPFRRWKEIEYCLHIFRVEYPSVVELILVDIEEPDHSTQRKNRVSHPWHLHGYDQYLVDQGLFETEDYGKELQNLLDKLERREITAPDYPILKDTWLVPSGGYVVVRIIANNPGFWFMHCHIALHHERGMSAVLKVGTTRDHPPPPDYFPKCSNYLETPDLGD